MIHTSIRREHPDAAIGLRIGGMLDYNRAMSQRQRHFTALDRLLSGIDNTLRTLGGSGIAARPNPAMDTVEAPLTELEKRHVAALMRVNHAGEVAAQALYYGQAVVARKPDTARRLAEAAREEGDHLAWCRERLTELGGRPSRLDPLWYSGAFMIGMLAAAAGDRTSLGFVEETEKQVVAHLHKHCDRLPPQDRRSRRILDTMVADEARHGDSARAAGARKLPPPIAWMMRIASGIMTRTAYRL